MTADSNIFKTSDQRLKHFESVWNSGNTDEILRLFDSRADWQHMSVIRQGESEIRAFLNGRFRYFLHYKIKIHSWLTSSSKAAVLLESEWQSSKSGLWYRSEGLAIAVLSENNTIKYLNTLTHGTLRETSY